MTSKQLKAAMEKHKPFTPQDAMRKCGLTLRYIGEGSYREVYDIVGSPWVIKFPLTEWDPKRHSPLVDWLRRHRIHAHYEINAHVMINRSDTRKDLQEYVPKMLWYDWETGVVIAEKCKPSVDKKIAKSLRKKFAKHFKKANDIKTGNIGRNAKGEIKVIDMGMLEEPSEASTDTSAS